MSRKYRKFKPSIEARLMALRKALENELKGIKEWEEMMRLMLERNPTDTWTQGMLRHYHKRIKELELKLADMDVLQSPS